MARLKTGFRNEVNGGNMNKILLLYTLLSSVMDFFPAVMCPVEDAAQQDKSTRKIGASKTHHWFSRRLQKYRLVGVKGLRRRVTTLRLKQGHAFILDY